MQMRGTPRDLLPGDPVCSPMATVLAEATTQLIRILHRTDHWTQRINKTMIERLHKIKPCFREAAGASGGGGGGQRLKKSRSVQSREEHDAQRESQDAPTRPEDERGRHGRQHGLGELSEHHLRTLCTEVWPVLAIIGGADAGLRVGGRCVHKQTGRHATLLGVVKEGSTSAKVQWDEAEITIRYGETRRRLLSLPRWLFWCRSCGASRFSRCVGGFPRRPPCRPLTLCLSFLLFTRLCPCFLVDPLSHLVFTRGHRAHVLPTLHLFVSLACWAPPLPALSLTLCFLPLSLSALHTFD